MPAAADVATVEVIAKAEDAARPQDVATAELRPSMVAAVRRDQCPSCGSAMASDQRYCVECGERRGPPRVPLPDGPAQRARAQEARDSDRQRGRARASVNSTLIAGIGTLLLAMGVGVLIGRSANSTSAKAPPAQIVTVAGGGATAGTTATSTAAQPPPAASHGSAARGAAAPASKSAAKTPSAPPPKAVKVGTPGKGPGYQNGHFTGNFFGTEGE